MHNCSFGHLENHVLGAAFCDSDFVVLSVLCRALYEVYNHGKKKVDFNSKVLGIGT